MHFSVIAAAMWVSPRVLSPKCGACEAYVQWVMAISSNGMAILQIRRNPTARTGIAPLRVESAKAVRCYVQVRVELKVQRHSFQRAEKLSFW